MQSVMVSGESAEICFAVDKLTIAPGKYYCNLHLDEDASSYVVVDQVERAFPLIIEEGDYYGEGFIHGKNIDTMFVILMFFFLHDWKNIYILKKKFNFGIGAIAN